MFIIYAHAWLCISWKYLLYLPFGHPTSRPLGHHHWRNIRGCTPDAPSWCITPGAHQISLRKTTPSLQWWCTGKTCESAQQRFPLGGAWLLVILVCTKWSTPNVTGAWFWSTTTWGTTWGGRHTYDHCWCILLMYTSVATALAYNFLAKYTSITPTSCQALV